MAVVVSAVLGNLQSDIRGGEAPATGEAEAGLARQPIGALLAGDNPDGFLLTKMEELRLAEANCLLSGRTNGVSGGQTLDQRCWGTTPVRSLGLLIGCLAAEPEAQTKTVAM